ncbi:GyrI-like domain-containing protein [Flavobacterium sp. H122]|uniref:GyrI-like domain-containing protein n=1 Tax=Flavobacterium sp. H122 TaxID=2529860 RepID=UPI001B7D9023|nr:GyrI-like domain-containing protein [Flavobacterium sp. H122]
MKIAKYLFLLILLLAGTISVFVATKDGKYAIKHKKVIDVSRDIVYKYVTDTKNWDSINPWAGEKFSILSSEKTENESITQQIILNDIENQLKLELRDTLNKKTLAIWSTEGDLSFQDKFLSIIGRGKKNDFEDRFEEGLSAVNKTLTREINSFDIKIDGFIKRDTVFYIQRPLVSTKEQIPMMIKHFLPKLQKILSSTGTPSNGSPFLIYHVQDSSANKFKYSIAIPLEKKIYTTTDSDIITGQINPSSTLKATVKGNYIHLNKALQDLYKELPKYKLEVSDKYKYLEVISKNPLTDKSASNWVTEIYLPVRPIKKEVAPVKKEKKLNQDSITKAIIKDILNADKKK